MIIPRYQDYESAKHKTAPLVFIGIQIIAESIIITGDNNMDKIYMDNASTTFPKPECVYEYMDQFYRHCGAAG